MISFVALLSLICLAEARPGFMDATPSISFDPYILGGAPCPTGTYPYQGSQERLGAVWSHSCGCVILTPLYSLTAAHCIDGASVAIIRVLAGAYDRSNLAGTQTVNSNLLTMHNAYGMGQGTFPNDIGIIRHATLLTFGTNVAAAVLPPDNSNQYVGVTVILSGWGRTSASNVLPTVLQCVSIPVISEAQCNAAMAPVSGASCNAGHIAVYSATNNVGSCNGDSGGPMTAPGLTGPIVAGVTSWGISGGGACLPSYPSVYTRTSFFLAWIAANTPPTMDN